MTHRRTIGLCLAVAGSLSTAAHAGARQDAGWGTVMALPKGALVRVTPFEGARLLGTVEHAGPDVLRLLSRVPDPVPPVVSLTRQEIRMLERVGRRSWKGTAIGAGLGALAGVLTLVTVDPKDGRTTAIRVHHELPVMLGTTGIGAGAGALADLIRRPPVEVLYVAPAPAPHAKLIVPGSEIITPPNDRGRHGRGTGQPDGIAERHLRQSP